MHEAFRLPPVIFFIRVPQLAQKATDGGRMCHNARGHLKRTCKFWQRDVTILCHQFFEEGLMGGKLTMTFGTTSERGLNCAGLAELTFPPDPGRS